MHRFAFRLDKLLEYRRLQEKWAKDEFLARTAKRIEGENEIAKIKAARTTAMQTTYSTIEGMRAQENYVSRLEDEKRAVEAAVAVLAGEEELARQKWLSLHRGAEVLQKLREKELDLWTIEDKRRVQRDLDDWAVMRRAS